jgi:hypothetical protein
MEETMKPHRTHILAIGLMILFSLVACSQRSQSSSVTIPTSTPQATRDIFTATPLATPTPVLTPTPKVSPLGTSLLIREDGSTQFTDHPAGVQMVFPSGWLAVRVGEQEYYSAWETQVTQNPIFLDIFASMQNLDPKVFRVSAFDIRLDHIVSDNVSNIDVIFSEGDTNTLSAIKANEINNPPPLRKYKLLSWGFFETSQGIQALNLEIQWEYLNSARETFTGYRRRVVFKVPAGGVTVDLLLSLDKKELTMPEFDEMINNILLITP